MVLQPPSSSALNIVHDEARQCFEAEVDGQLCVCDYRREGDVVAFTHTEVPPTLQGRGLAAALVREALAWAAAQGLRVRPRCSYVAAYLRRHPQVATRDAP